MGELADFLVERDQNFRKARLPALYSDFRPQRTLNPDGFQANVSAWRQALARAAWEGRIASQLSAPNLLVVNVDEQLVRSLESKQFGRPLALGTVVREAVADKDLYPLDEFTRAKESIYASKTWAQVPWSVVSWAAGQLFGGGKSTSGEDKVPRGRFVVLRNVEATAKSLAERVSAADSRFDRTYTKTHFQKTFADALVQDRRLSETDVDILLVFLSRDKGIVVYDGKVVKIKGSSTDEDETTITEEDEAVSSLKELIADMKQQTALLTSRVDELAATAKEAVVKKNKVAALAALKSKKMTEASLEKRFATLNQLEDVAARIQEARDNVQLVSVMEASAGALKGLNEKVGGADRVGDVVDRLREQMGEVDEVGKIISEAGAAPVVDEFEVDEELEAMEREEREKVEAAERKEREAREEREAEETRRRLEAEMADLKTPVAEPVARQDAKSPTGETAESLERMGLEEREREREKPMPAQ
ncbi:Snf7 family protein [Colletotrichum scovillei]|uniref:Snf7 family protein n=1 Tax=Colletotrichum scovillei TaxID=1209932 RepID=A0A9P7R5R3_9PEZI|nr:Snf7 family protein [Colletotrichum scovillei]KAF4773822.1 Snf7 family protein [Colletotrichum scovillei]KAG7048316.1 Snf7 family protein [Colletotrichum scovillei]KAG7065483.1 Snf7 family protein [Colletotrichum scovillei]KAG7068046.1 Snf7 family protein [Colletotrichum scovillei]